jgi:hypothetical protein
MMAHTRERGRLFAHSAVNGTASTAWRAARRITTAIYANERRRELVFLAAINDLQHVLKSIPARPTRERQTNRFLFGLRLGGTYWLDAPLSWERS